MVEETIQAIKKTEKEAEELLQAADDKSAQILDEAAVQASQIKTQAQTEGDEKSKAALEAAKVAGEEQMQQALSNVEAEITSLKEDARAKEEEVIQAVIADLI